MPHQSLIGAWRAPQSAQSPRGAVAGGTGSSGAGPRARAPCGRSGRRREGRDEEGRDEEGRVKRGGGEVSRIVMVMERSCENGGNDREIS